ncbi:hypothetical protein H8356DRAFT_1341816 [Neocallimastix lanati (nom. inval.)]|nr:hypothetical protein H8356DRAFT_1341816 [Neocallimastix sp. JGI-2020a]
MSGVQFHLTTHYNPFDSLTLNRTSHRLHYDRASQFGVIPAYCKSSLVNVSAFPNLEKESVDAEMEEEKDEEEKDEEEKEEKKEEKKEINEWTFITTPNAWVWKWCNNSYNITRSYF